MHKSTTLFNHLTSNHANGSAKEHRSKTGQAVFRFSFTVFLFTSLVFLFTSLVNAQESKVAKVDSLQITNSNIPNSIQAEQGDVDFTDGTNSLIRITDEGTFGAIEIKTGVPSTTTDKLYNNGGTLMFHNTTLGGGSGATEIDDLSDGKTDTRSLFLGNGSGANDDGSHNANTAVGRNTLNANISGTHNIAYGYYSQYLNTVGSANLAIGSYALYNNTNGDSNIGLGYNANYFNQEGSNNTIIGIQAGAGTAVHNKSGNIFLGYSAGYNEASDNKLYIENSNSSAPLIWGDFTDGSEQVKINGDFHVTGDVSGVEINDLTDAKSDGNTTAASLFLGPGAGENDDAGTSDGIKNRNTAVGYRALQSNTTGYSNLANGYNSLQSNTTGYLNTANGYNALELNTEGFHNTANGVYSLNSNTTGETNSATGSNALRFNTSGNNNTASGMRALTNNTTGNNNTGFGKDALKSNTTGSGNVALGFEAGYNETSDNKLYIENSNSSSPLIWGDFANDLVAINGKFGVGTQNPDAKVTIIAASTGEVPLRIKIGGATKFKVEENGGVAIGLNSSTTPANGLYVHGDLNYNAALTSVSDKRFKTNIKPIDNATERIKNIRGVYYDWNRTKFPERDFTERKQIGVLAQDVEKEFPELVRTGEDGYKSVDYTKLAPILIEAVKEQEASIKIQDERIKKLEEENAKIRIQNAEIRTDNEELKKQFVKNANLKSKIELLEQALNKLVRQQPKIKVSKK